MTEKGWFLSLILRERERERERERDGLVNMKASKKKKISILLPPLGRRVGAAGAAGFITLLYRGEQRTHLCK